MTQTNQFAAEEISSAGSISLQELHSIKGGSGPWEGFPATRPRDDQIIDNLMEDASWAPYLQMRSIWLDVMPKHLRRIPGQTLPA